MMVSQGKKDLKFFGSLLKLSLDQLELCKIVDRAIAGQLALTSFLLISRHGILFYSFHCRLLPRLLRLQLSNRSTCQTTRRGILILWTPWRTVCIYGILCCGCALFALGL